MKEKLNNKGFSLVEIIIVIAIMVVLGVVVVIVLMKYPEQGRNANDIQNATALSNAILVYSVDPERTEELSSGSITIGKNPQTVSGFALGAFTNAKLSSMNGSTLGTICDSSEAWTSYTISWDIDENTSQLVFSYSSSGGPAGTDRFAELME